MITLTIEDLARLLHTTKRAIQVGICRNPDAYPPKLDLPTKAPLWLEKDVIEWLESRRTAA